MTIRLATVDDLPRLQPLVGWACAELEESFGTPRADELVFTMVAHGVRTGDAVVVAEHDGDLVGWCARVHMPGMPDGYAEGVGTWVFAPFRREHVARDMREMADRHAKERGVKYVNGIAAKGNAAGLESCLAEGYEVVGYQLRKKL